MNTSKSENTCCKLSDSRFEECIRIALRYLKGKPSICNREIRKEASIGYDQAIFFFNRAIAEKRLVREGKASGTRYVVPSKRNES
jgi:hypothetical protein